LVGQKLNDIRWKILKLSLAFGVKIIHT